MIEGRWVCFEKSSRAVLVCGRSLAVCNVLFGLPGGRGARQVVLDCPLMQCGLLVHPTNKQPTLDVHSISDWVCGLGCICQGCG